MADTPAYVVVDHILKSENEQITEQNTFNVSFTNLVEGDRNAIADWIKEDLDYSELKNAPALPPDTNNESPAYETVSGERKIKGFDEVAFTGDYDDLSGAPGIPVEGYNNGQVKDFNPIAFTGITNLGNVQVSEILDLRSYSGGVDALGQDDAYIDGMPSGLGTAVAAFCTSFDTNKGKKPYYIITNAVTGGKVYQVLNISILKDGPDTCYYKIDIVNVNTSDYPYANGTKGLGVLDDIEITSKLGCFIFDLVNNCIYYKSSDIDNGVTSYNDLTDKPTLFSGDYDDLTNKPTYNLDASANSSSITGLADVATTGNYDDLENSFYNITLSDFIYKYENNSFTQLTGNDYNNIVSLGLHNRYIEDIDKIYNENNDNGTSLKTAILNLIEAFSNNKRCGFITQFTNQLFIENISTNYSGNNLNYASIISKPILIDNYDSNTINTINFEDNLLYSLYTSFFIFDFINNIVYTKYILTFPLGISDQSMTFDNLNIVKVNISNKSNNKLELITSGPEAGLYVE